MAARNKAQTTARFNLFSTDISGVALGGVLRVGLFSWWEPPATATVRAAVQSKRELRRRLPRWEGAGRGGRGDATHPAAAPQVLAPTRQKQAPRELVERAVSSSGLWV